MAKEHKCRKCKLTYKGLKETCPFCHRLTRLGAFNRAMCVVGYGSLLAAVIFYIYKFIIKAFVAMAFLAPLIKGIVIVAVIIAICVFIFR